MQTGLMTLGDLLANPLTGAATSEAERHRSFVDQAVLAEQVGFDAVHLGEHHFTDYMLSAPPIVLAAIAERTTDLILSTAVTLVGNLDPVRVAEDYATVDVLSGGRAEIVAGRGNLFVDTYEGFGHPVETARERYDEHVALLVELLSSENVTWDGEYRSPLRSHTTRPRPFGDRIPMWIGAGSKDSAELAADLGCFLMVPSVFGTPETFKPIVEIYRARWEAVGHDPLEARVGACSHTHVGATTEGARNQWEPFYRNYWTFVGGLLAQSGRWPAFDFETLLLGPAICGSPEQVIDRIGQWESILETDRHLFMFDLGGIDRPLLSDTIELFGDQVLPHVG